MTAISGRPDGRLANYIYDGGLNGIIDWRLPAVANDSPEEAAKVEVKVENGTYRGLEKLVWTKVYGDSHFSHPSNKIAVFTTEILFYVDFASKDLIGEVIGGYNPSTGETVSGVITRAITGGYLAIGRSAANLPSGDFTSISVASGIDAHAILTTKINLSVSGNFTQTDVIGDPANILQTDALKDGWLGTWCPVIPDGISNDFDLSRKSLVSSVTWTTTTNNGASWGSYTNIAVDTVKNTLVANIATGKLGLISYKAFAKQTKPSTNKPVYNAKAGLMGMFATSHYQQENGCVLLESLLGKVGTNSTGIRVNGQALISSKLHVNGQLTDSKTFGGIIHTPLKLSKPNNSSQAVKVLPYQISNNGQGSIGYQANELTWGSPTVINIQGTALTSYTVGNLYSIDFGDGYGGLRYMLVRCVRPITAEITKMRMANGQIHGMPSGVKYFDIVAGATDGGWGDDSTIKVTADGSDTFVDLNGNTNLSVVHELAIPYTWTSNHARAGEQVDGVDV